MSKLYTCREMIGQFLLDFVRGISMVSVYGPNHRVAIQAVMHGYAWLADIHKQRPKMILGILGDELFCDNQAFHEFNDKNNSFIWRLKDAGIARLTFLKGVTEEEYSRFIDLLAPFLRKREKNEKFQSRLQSHGIRNILVGGLYVNESDQRVPLESSPVFDRMKESYLEGLDFLQESVDDLRHQRSLNSLSLRNVVNRLIQNLFMHQDMLLMLTSIKMHDQQLYVHSLNVCILTLMQARALGFSQKHMTDICQAALLHNVGALFFPDHASEGRGDSPESIPFTVAEGAGLLLDTGGISPLAAIVTFERTLKWEEHRYPSPFFGESLNLVSLMVAIAESYDRLRMQPGEVDPQRPEIVYANMSRNSDSSFHPDMLEVFFSVLGVYPPGTLVLLDNHDVGLVVQESRVDKWRPKVAVVYDREGVRTEFPRIVNLLERKSRENYERSIVRSIPPADEFEAMEMFAEVTDLVAEQESKLPRMLAR